MSKAFENEIAKVLKEGLGYEDQEEFDEDTSGLRESLLSLYTDFLAVQLEELNPPSKKAPKTKKSQKKREESSDSGSDESEEKKTKTNSFLEFKKEKLEEDDSLTVAKIKAMWKAVDASEKKQYAERAKEVNKENGF